jgi:hypothetical protein
LPFSLNGKIVSRKLFRNGQEVGRQEKDGFMPER